MVIDATTNAVIANIDSPATCGEMQLLDESVWVTNCFETDDVAVIDVHGTESRGLHAGGRAGTPLQIDGECGCPRSRSTNRSGISCGWIPRRSRSSTPSLATRLRTSWAPASARCGTSHGIRAPSSGSRSTPSLTKRVDTHAQGPNPGDARASPSLPSIGITCPYAVLAPLDTL